MQPDGQNRGTTARFSQNSPPSAGQPPLGLADRTTVQVPTHPITALTGNMPHRLPPLPDLRESVAQPPSVLHSEQPSSAESFRQRSHSNASPSHSRGYTEPSQRNLLPTIARARRQTMSYDPRSPTGISNIQQQSDSGYGPQSCSPVPHYSLGNHSHRNNQPDHPHRVAIPQGLYVPPIAGTRSQMPLIPANPIGHSHNMTTGYSDVGYSTRPMSADSFQQLYHPSTTSPPGYYHETSHVTPFASADLTLTSCANVPFHVPQQDRTMSYATPSLSFSNSTDQTHTYQPTVAGMMDLSVDNPPLTSSTTITTTLHMNVNVSADRQLTMNPGIHQRSSSSSNHRMNNNNNNNTSPPLSTPSFNTHSPGSSWPRYPQQHIASTSTSMSVSALGNALELKAQLTYSPPALSQSQSSPDPLQQFRQREQQMDHSHPLMHTRPTTSSGRMERVKFETGTGNIAGSNSEPAHGTDEIFHSEIPDDPNLQSLPARKKKRSKMHVCTVCGKEFPRPSGLHTHMNTHNNMKPYPCTFPGCERTFGVRSNAKRHLRTHGIAPNSASTSTSTGSSSTTTNSNAKKASIAAKPQPYIVGFSEPVIVGEPTRGEHIHPDSTEGRIGANDRVGSGEGGRGGFRLPGSSGPSFFKLRWMPPSSTSRTSTTSASALRSVRETEVFDEDDEDEDEGGMGGGKDGADWDDRTDRSGHSTLESFSCVGANRKEGCRSGSVDNVKDEPDENGSR